jgi:hypothetical protein
MADTIAASLVAPAQLDEARSAFIREVQQLPGISAQTCNGRTPAEQTIRVFVPDILGPEVSAVYAIEVRIRRRFHHTDLNIEIEEAEVQTIGANDSHAEGHA